MELLRLLDFALLVASAQTFVDDDCHDDDRYCQSHYEECGGPRQAGPVLVIIQDEVKECRIFGVPVYQGCLGGCYGCRGRGGMYVCMYLR